MSAEDFEKLVAHFREQAGACRDYGSPFTGALIDCMGDDLEARGPVHALVGAWPTNPRADALSLRLAGALHFAVLNRRDAALAAQYPAARGDWRIEDVWPLARAFFERERPWTEQFIRSAPQTNEVRRSIALLVGFLDVARQFPGMALDTLEIGASAGLNLNWDKFAYRTSSWTWGSASPVTIDTDWTGPSPALDARIDVRSRAACDLNPLDIGDPTARLQLKSYIWADQPERMARFDGAAALAVEAGVRVERADAAEWLTRKFAARRDDGVTAVYHSIFLQYPPRETRERIRAVIEEHGARASARAPLAWVRLEPEAVLDGVRDSARMIIDVITWPGGARRILGYTDGHVRSVQSVG